jgi:hypothetical protein
MNKIQAEARLAQLSMNDLPLVEIAAKPVAVPNDWFAKYKALRVQFMKSLTDSVEELSFLNLSQEEFMALVMGRMMPVNTTFRLRVPLMYGGKLEIDNMFMCKTFPHSQNMDRFIIEQAGMPNLWLTNPARKIYLPAHGGGGGPGGNATDDRLAQMAAGIAVSQAKGNE